MRTLILISILLFLPMVAAANTIIYNTCIQGNGRTKTETRDISGFKVVDSSGVFDITTKSSVAKYKVKVTTDENIIKHISTTLQGNRIMLFSDRSICPEIGPRIEIEMPDIEAIVSSGSDNIHASGINNNNLHLIMDGSGDVILNGRVHSFDASLNGSGTIDASHLVTAKTAISISGSGDATVNAVESLKVDVSGVGDVNYYGHPKKIEQEINGVGDLNAMD